MASKHRDIGLKFRHRSTPNTKRVTKNVSFFFGWREGGGYQFEEMSVMLKAPVGRTGSLKTPS